jgi:mannose-6-phosphate isomerase-like protein (cupin superfamily)
MIPPGTATQLHFHPKTEEFYYVIEGCGRMKIGDEVNEVVVGDSILIPADAVHTLQNTGSADLKILCCCAPPYSHDDTVLLNS